MVCSLDEFLVCSLDGLKLGLDSVDGLGHKGYTTSDLDVRKKCYKKESDHKFRIEITLWGNIIIVKLFGNVCETINKDIIVNSAIIVCYMYLLICVDYDFLLNAWKLFKLTCINY